MSPPRDLDGDTGGKSQKNVNKKIDAGLEKEKKRIAYKILLLVCLACE
jgi:hypothetical protein